MYCDACTSKTARLSASKDPVRVCEPCFGIVDSLRARTFNGPASTIDSPPPIMQGPEDV